jgi:hypothetical protein
MPAVFCPVCGSLLVLSSERHTKLPRCPDCLATLTADLQRLSACQVIAYLMLLHALQPAELKPTLSPGAGRLGRT